MSLRDWLSKGWVIEHQTSNREISDLLGLVERDLAACQTSGLVPDWQLSIAYNAALQAATAALAASGYRASREAHHYHVIQSLAFTVKLDSKALSEFDAFRRKRNIGGYEIAGQVSEQEAEEMYQLARKLQKEVINWIAKTHPKFIKADKK